MHTFLLLCSLLLCNGVRVSVQKKMQKLPNEEEESPAQLRTPQTVSRGWGDDIEWVQTYEEGLARSKHSKKPLMVIHHLEECPYSQALRKAFASSPEIQQMAQEDFIMLNLVHSSSDDNMAPDGHYVPRILFVGQSKGPSPTVTNTKGKLTIKLLGTKGTMGNNLEPPDEAYPSMTVRADLTGKYGNRMYAYEPEDISTLIENMRQAKLLLHAEL